MEFRLLGPVEFGMAGRWSRAARRQERCLLAVLLLEAGHPVPVERLIDVLWAGQPPAGARAAVRTYLSRLRGALTGVDGTGATAARLLVRSGGHLFDVDRQQVDVHRFDALFDEAQTASVPPRR